MHFVFLLIYQNLLERHNFSISVLGGSAEFDEKIRGKSDENKFLRKFVKNHL